MTKALMRFAFAVKDLPVSRGARINLLLTSLKQVDGQAYAIFLDRWRKYRIGTETAYRRWLYRNVLKACGVEARHV